MKKNHAYRWVYINPSVTKLLKIMKLASILLFACVLSVHAGGFSQDVKVNLSLNGVKLTKFFKAIEKETKFRFAFSNDILPAGRIVTINVKQALLSRVMNEVMSTTNLKYRFDEVSGIFIISEKPGGPLKEMEAAIVRTITGNVTNEKGEPLAEVSVLVKGSSKATLTSANGSFSIDVEDNAKALIFSFVGMVSKEVNIEGRRSVQVVLELSNKVLDDVVIVGYGTQKSRTVTGAIGKIGSKQVKEVPVLGLDQAILGRVAGVLVTENSAEPGGEVSIKMRGIASITGGSEPLVVVDGIPMSVNLNTINPNDIESIDLLKDAAATAIYGSRASAGVILVTTKRGRKDGKSVVSFDAFTSLQYVAKKVPLLNGAQFAQLANENLVNGGQAPNPAWADPSKVLNTDWQDAMFNPGAPMHNANISIAGGSEKLRSFLSFGFVDQDGIIQRSNYKRFTSRINLDYDVSDKIKIGATVNFGFVKNTNTRTQEEFWGVLLNAMRAQPTDPVFTSQEGAFGDHLYGLRGYAVNRSSINNNYYALSNPVFTNQYYSSNGNQNTTLLTNVYGEAELIKGLKFKSVFGYNINNGIGSYGNPYALPPAVDVTSRAFYSENWSRGLQWNWINTLDYSKTIGSHNFSVLVGTDALKGTYKGIGGGGNDAPEDQQSLSASALAGRTVGGAASPASSLFSYLSRLNYSFEDKYLLTLNFRRDGSSNFLAENRFGNFTSFSAGWRISKERFMEKATFLDDLKLRVSYGSVGNQNIPPLSFATFYGNDGGNFGYSFGAVPTLVSGLRPQNLSNSAIQWERNTEVNIGFDASILKGRFTITADYYKKRLSDLLGLVPLPNFSAPHNGQYLANAFTMENSGLELTLGYRQQFGKVNFSANANFSTLNNEVTGLLPGNTSGFLQQSISMIGSAFNDGGAQTRTSVGERIGNFYGYVFDGIIQNAAELAASGMAGFDAKVGDKRFKDISGPLGKPDGIVNDRDRTNIGNGLPGYYYGFSTRAEYSGFDINLFFNGQGDVQVANMTNAVLYHMRFHNSTGIVNGSADLLNSWKGEGTSNTLPRNSYDAPTSNRFFSTDYIQNGAFLRLRNVALGYTLPVAMAKKIAMSSARLYVSAQNLLTITKYTGYDPEVGSAQIGTRAQTAGVDFGRFPRARIFTVGVNVQF